MGEREYTEKMNILRFMVNNGYHLCNRTMDDFCRDFSVEDLKNFCRTCCGEFHD